MSEDRPPAETLSPPGQTLTRQLKRSVSRRRHGERNLVRQLPSQFRQLSVPVTGGGGCDPRP
jgi:hypothetical protein